MLVTDSAFPNENATEPQLYTITAGGFSATADAFARDPESDGLWFLSMVGSQTALKAIWAALLKQPPEAAFLIKGADGLPHAGGYQRCIVPPETVGTWTTKIARLSAAGGWHAMVYTRMAEFAFERKSEPVPDAYAERELERWAAGELEPLSEVRYPLFDAPPAPAGEILFTTRPVDPEAAAAEARGSGLWQSAEIFDALWPQDDVRSRRLMPLRRGHLGTL